jgi:hypothetical protein
MSVTFHILGEYQIVFILYLCLTHCVHGATFASMPALLAKMFGN